MLVIDDFIRSPVLTGAVKSDKNFFPITVDENNPEEVGYTLNGFHDQECDCFAPYMFWEGWWKSPADTLRKKIIQEIWSAPGVLEYERDEIAGFEYWCRTFNAGQFLKPHVDEDTFLYEKSHEFNAPVTGCIWYGFSESGDGGFLELHEGSIEGNPSDALEEKHMETLLSPPDRLERIAYKTNRLIVFDAGRRVHQTQPAGWGDRQVMVVNVWHKDSPPSALATGQFYREGQENRGKNQST